MFNLEQAIADWRRQMLAAGIKTPVPMKELESHLREDVEQLVQSGSSPQQALAVAVRRMGQANALNHEFKKNERPFMKKILLLLVGIFGILFGPGLILPALAKHKQLGLWNDDIIWPLFLGGIITLTGVVLTVVGFTQRRA